MLSAHLQRERDQLLGQLRPGAPHSEAFRRSIEGCFDLAATVAGERQSRADLPAAQRKTELAQIVDGQLLPRLAALTAPARKVKPQVEAERARTQGINLPANVSDLFEDIGRVEAAAYFARRELEPLSAMGRFELHSLLNSENA